MKNNKKFYITTPIYYPSDNLHIGHCYTTVIADTMARYKRLRGFDVMFVTGTDEHGQKIETKAKEAGTTPKAFVDGIVAGITDLWALMGITYDRFIRSTDTVHVKRVQKIFTDLYDRGEIYKSDYEGSYCKPCESFWTASQLKDGKCPDCGRDVELAKEEAYFFRLSNYTDRILALYEQHPDFLQPQSRVNEMVNNFLKPGLEDLCVSRTTFSWGVPVEFDPGHVVYVWVDALSSYITALGYPDKLAEGYDEYWPADIHLMAKEIVRFHAIVWPALLMALELPLPDKIFGHGWLLMGGEKMGKSRGNVVDPVVLCARYGVDAIRYFLLREIPFGHDGNFTNEALIARVNADLANDLGNLVSRTVAMAQKYFGEKLPVARQSGEFDDQLLAMAGALKASVEANIEKLLMPQALTEIFRVVSRANKYIDETMPWVLAKDEANAARLATVLYNLLETVRICAVLLQPFMPATSAEIFRQTGVQSGATDWESAARFGVLTQDVAVQRGDALFPRIDAAKELAELDALSAKAEVQAQAPAHAPAQEPAPQAAQIAIDDFAKVELIVARVESCEPVPKSDRLLLLQLDDGRGGRQVVSGIAQWYTPDDLVGKKLILVANLAPAKLRGVASQGMILAADAGGRAQVVFAPEDAEPGAKVR